jgi:uncharacterized protein (TIGR02145 family)
MLTNLAYTGGGATNYNDTRTITLGTAASYTEPRYYPNTGGSAVTTEPTNPSTTSGSGGQYGYLYNWCAAMGGHTNACTNKNNSNLDTAISICPANWRLPTGGNNSELATLNTSVNSGANNSDAGLRTTWLAVYSGIFNSSYANQNNIGYYWSSSANNTVDSANRIILHSTSVDWTNTTYRTYGYAVRCVANV